MKKHIIKLALFTALLVAQTHFAYAYDARIVSEQYDTNRVYNVYTKVGKVTLIQLESDETLVNSPSSLLGMGDTEAWHLGVRGNNISFKPAKAMPNTNLVVVTNKRTYSFELKNIKTGDATYILRFDYPDTLKAKRDAENAAETSRLQATAEAKAQKIIRNTDYVWRGDNDALKPTATYDDGRFMRLVYDHAGALPVFYKVLPDGKEGLLNYSIDGNEVVLHELNKTTRVRLNKEVIEIVNKSYQVPKFNKFGTGEYGTVRIEKADAPLEKGNKK